MTSIHSIMLPVPGIEELQAEARAEGYNFLDRLLDDWQSGENRFDGPGEIFVGAFDKDVLVAVGGLNRDPFLDDAAVGRIRRVYVRAAWRNQGLGRALVTFLTERASQNFRSVRLRAENPSAARLYERLGFRPIDDPNATHSLTPEPRPTGAGPCLVNAISAGTDTL
jgi:GNAT superfamily N-acetyltransferase